MALNLPKTMRAVGLYKYLPITDPESFLDLEVSLPAVGQSDVLVKVKAVSVNPIDTKQRAPKPRVEASPRVLGWDGSGVVVDKGSLVNKLKLGDHVYFSGALGPSGCNAQYYSVHEGLVAKKPTSLSFEQAAAMPLTTLTAYEIFYDLMKISEKDRGKSLLIINSAGGAGSIATQLARHLGLTVIGTAARETTRSWSLQQGAQLVLDHKKDLLPQLKDNGYASGVDYILVNYDPYPYWNTIMEAVKPMGTICLIVDSSGLVDIKPLKAKSITLASEMMMTRYKYDTPDKVKLAEYLDLAAELFDKGVLKHTLTKTLSPLNAQTLKQAHKIIEEQTMVGKLVITNDQV
ncbi:hypothetical protein JYU34_012730 [Plutella xylostella]|uniref:Enoyl reductase (ER) domain-containing protein n=1 Tax=Plutella xylostella TaxID=51655 RepID=A0ABQ7QC11_PLUXY|nr:hypothetical protein JYU34_012730 [Plutella xylostella]